MPAIAHFFFERHESSLVALAVTLTGFACWTSVNLAMRARIGEGRTRTLWLIAAGSVFGAGAWSTFFISMLALKDSKLIGYGLASAELSLVIAVAVATVGFALILQGKTLFGGIALGLAIAGMHLSGMAVLAGAVHLEWDVSVLLAAIGVCTICSVGAAYAGTRIRNIRGRAVAALLLLTATESLHFIAVSGTHMVLYSDAMTPAQMIAPHIMLAITVASAVVLLVALALAAAGLDSHLVRRRNDEAVRLRAHIDELEATKANLEEASTELRAALEKADAANASKSAFLAAMSHELRTPLNAVIGFSDLLLINRRDPLTSPSQRSYVEDIRKSGTHLLALINDILDLTRLDSAQESLNESVVFLPEAVGNAVQMIRARATELAVTVDVEIAADIPPMRLDERRILQVLLNLLSNAVKFTPAQGSICIRCFNTDSGVAIEIRDTGIGIATDDIPRALERFGQVDTRLARKYEGAGLGLPLAIQLTELHGGRLELESEVAKGTIVRVHLPTSRIVERVETAA